MQNLPLGIKLFTVGFPTVFAVLSLIVFAGSVLQKRLIPLLDRWFPEEEAVLPGSSHAENQSSVAPEVIAAVSTAVHAATKGKYNVLDIKSNP